MPVVNPPSMTARCRRRGAAQPRTCSAITTDDRGRFGQFIARLEGFENDAGSPKRSRWPVFTLIGMSSMPFGTRNGVAGLSLQRHLHEIGDDRGRKLAAGATLAHRLRIVVADIDADRQIGREADEPGIALVIGRARSCRRPACRPPSACWPVPRSTTPSSIEVI